MLWNIYGQWIAWVSLKLQIIAYFQQVCEFSIDSMKKFHPNLGVCTAPFNRVSFEMRN